MSNLSQHRQALFCNDSQSIADYQKNMNTAVEAVTNWLKNDKMYTGGSIRELREAISFQLRHGVFKCGNIHLRLVIDWHSDHRLKTHAHHCHVFLHTKMRVF